MSQAGPGNDINAGSPGSQKAPTQIPASLVQPAHDGGYRIKTLKAICAKIRPQPARERGEEEAHRALNCGSG